MHRRVRLYRAWKSRRRESTRLGLSGADKLLAATLLTNIAEDCSSVLVNLRRSDKTVRDTVRPWDILTGSVEILFIRDILA